MISITTRLTDWIYDLRLEDVPADVVERAKCIALDGLACGLVASHLPWSTIGTNAILEFESPGSCSVWGWDKKVGPLPAALLNASYVQGFELDDFHKTSPNHGASLLMPSLVALAEHEAKNERAITGKEFLLALVVGLEVSPRVGLGLGGKKLLSRGIHSGTIMGHIGAAVGCAKLLKLNKFQTEGALGIAATQACGLMSAQTGSMVKRMQHGFASRNGLFAALMTRANYTGIEQVMDQPYGGFYAVWGKEGDNPEDVVKGLGEDWEIHRFVIKEHASMGAVHTPIECMAKIQQREPRMKHPSLIKNIHVELGHAAYHHGCFPLPAAPIPPTAAQMCVGFGLACQILDGRVFVLQFTQAKIDRPEIRDIVDKKVTYAHDPALDDKASSFTARITVTFIDGSNTVEELPYARTINPGLSNEMIITKAKDMFELVIPEERSEGIQHAVLYMESVEKAAVLGDMLRGSVPCPI